MPGIGACDVEPPSFLSSGAPLQIQAVDVGTPDDQHVGRLRAGAAISFETDRLLAPRSLSSGGVRVVSGDLEVAFHTQYDPARRRVQITFAQDALRPGLQYALLIDTSLLAWDGAPLASPVARAFVPTTSPAPTASAKPPPSLRESIAPLFRRRCGSGECHGGATPSMGLDLSSAEGVVASAVGVFSREREPRAGRGVDETDPRWGALLRVDPGRASRGRPEYSYLFYKIAGDGPLLGARMPPNAAPLAPQEIALVSDWIAAGAPQN